MRTASLCFGIFVFAIGFLEAGSQSINFGNGTIYSGFPLGIVIMVVAIWIIAFSFLSKPKTSSTENKQDAMKTVYKLAVSLVIALVALALIFNLPLVPTGTQTICVHTNCSSHEVYESIMQVYAPCSIFSCVGGSNVPTITEISGILSSGTESTLQSRGTANLTMAFNNPDQNTTISSISFVTPANASLTVYQCPSSSSCNVFSSSSLSIPSGKITAFNTTETAFYFSSPIISGETYSYVVSFTDGQSITGALNAQ
jgi:hypothetical protein